MSLPRKTYNNAMMRLLSLHPAHPHMVLHLTRCIRSLWTASRQNTGNGERVLPPWLPSPHRRCVDLEACEDLQNHLLLLVLVAQTPRHQ